MGEVIPTATPPVSTVSTVDAGVGQNKSTVEASPTAPPFYVLAVARDHPNVLGRHGILL